MAVDAPCWVEISLSSFANNVRHAAATLARDAHLMVAVKSDAYGHGGRELARVAVASGAHALAVLDIDTGVDLREAIPDTPMLAWLLAPSNDFARASRWGITLGISHRWQLDKLATECAQAHTSVHLKIDTGLHRNGALAADWPDLVAYAAQLEASGLITVDGVWSHLADTSHAEDRASLERFMDAVAIARAAGLTPRLLHIAASAAATDFPEARLDMVRVGISAYGVSPFDDRSATDMGFSPVMSAHARISYLEASTGTAHASMGFGDGLLEIPPGVGWVVAGGHTLTIQRIEVDHLVLEIPEGVTLTLGEVVTLWGAPERGSPRAEDWAGWASTIGDEIVTAVARHVPRRFVSESDPAAG